MDKPIEYLHFTHSEAINDYIKNKEEYCNKIQKILFSTSSSIKKEGIAVCFNTINKSIQLNSIEMAAATNNKVREIQPEDGEGISNIAANKVLQISNIIKNQASIIVEDSGAYLIRKKFINYDDFCKRRSKDGEHTKSFIKYYIQNSLSTGKPLAHSFVGEAVSVAETFDFKELSKQHFYIRNQSAFSSGRWDNGIYIPESTASGEIDLRLQIKEFGEYKKNRHFPALIMNFSDIPSKDLNKIEEFLDINDNPAAKNFSFRDESKKLVSCQEVFLKLKKNDNLKYLHLMTPRLASAIAYTKNFS